VWHARVCRPFQGSAAFFEWIQGLRARFARTGPWLPSCRAFGARRAFGAKKLLQSSALREVFEFFGGAGPIVFQESREGAVGEEAAARLARGAVVRFV
jgi:hypothetical protein